MDEYKESENIIRERSNETENAEDEFNQGDINGVIELIDNNPKQVIQQLKLFLDDVVPTMNEDFFIYLANADIDKSVYLQIWHYFLTGNPKNEQYIAKIDIIEKLIDFLPDSFEDLTLLLENVREQVVKFHKLNVIHEILPLSDFHDHVLLSRFLLAISTEKFELSCPKEDFHLFISSIIATDDFCTHMNTLKAIENFAKISYLQGVRLSKIIVENFGSFVNDEKLLITAFSALSSTLVLDRDSIPDFTDFWPLVIQTFSSGNEKLILKACDFFESAIIEFTNQFQPSDELLCTFFDMINEGSFSVRKHCVMIISSFVITCNSKEKLEKYLEMGACNAFLDFLEFCNEEELTEMLQSIYRIVADIDTLPDELIEEILLKIQDENHIDTENQIDLDLIRSILNIIDQYC